MTKYLKISHYELFQLRDRGQLSCISTNRKDLLFAPISSKEAKTIRAAATKA